MFDVRQRGQQYVTGVSTHVYAVRSNEFGNTGFLIHNGNEWKWVRSEDYEPVSSGYSFRKW